MHIKPVLLITLIILIILIIREIKYTEPTLFPGSGCLGGAVPPAAAGQHQEVPDWIQQ